MNDEPTFDPRRKSAIRELVVTTARTSRSSRGRGRRVAVVAALVVVAVGVSGGVAYALGTGLLSPRPVVSVAPVPSETATPTPVAPKPTGTATSALPTPAADPADPSTWVIGFDGVGPVTLGSSFDEQRQQLPTFGDITDPLCVGGYLDLQAPSGFSLLFVGGTDEPTATAAITFGDSGSTPGSDGTATPKTAAGIGLGSTEDELLAAYPGIEKTGSYGEDFPFYGLSDGNGGWIVFEIFNGTVGRIQVANEAVTPIENVSVKTMPSERCPA